ncbi:MAG TPA: asparagine synthase-related protein [Acidobacteriaceae bacterium]|nr:asparagine synthase-related protein [Acidobacteriaceae bacterium]
MSAIAGIWSFDGGFAVSSACQEMLRALKIYGAGDPVCYADASVAMGCCQLRLLPEDDFDTQPLSAPGVTAFVADIRLDNREDLAAALGFSTERLAVMADSEVLLAAWQRWREQCVEHVSGAFSFAVWNQPEQHLFLARDHTGERPLFYAANARSFAFASMPKGLHPLSFVGAEVDEDYVAHYLTLANIPIEQTIFRRIRRLPSGCALSVKRERIKLWRHWKTDRLADLRLGPPDEYLQCFRERFDRSVRARLRTRGSIGAQLSGGLDSSAVAATAARLLDTEGRALTCFTAVPRADFAGSSTTHIEDEGCAAAEVAALYPNIRHLLVDSSTTSFLDIIDRHNDLYDHPCFGPSNEVWFDAIMRRAKENNITLMLNGNCGNATFSYSGMPALSEWFRSGEWATLAQVAWQLVRRGGSSARAVVRNAVWPSLPFWLRSKTDPHMRGFSLDYSMLRPEIAQRMDLERSAFHDIHESASSGRGMLRSLLEYGDVADTPIAAQGGWQMDFRDPTYDRGVVEFCLTAPLEEFLRDGQQRSLARRAMAGRLPASTLTRTQRGRQSADWYRNLADVRGRMRAEVERLHGSPLASRMLNLERMRSLIENWPGSGFERPDINRSHHIALTRGFSVGKFLMHYDPDKK